MACQTGLSRVTAPLDFMVTSLWDASDCRLSSNCSIAQNNASNAVFGRPAMNALHACVIYMQVSVIMH